MAFIAPLIERDRMTAYDLVKILRIDAKSIFGTLCLCLINVNSQANKQKIIALLSNSFKIFITFHSQGIR